MADSSNLSLLDINIPIFLVLFVGYKVVMRTKIWKPEEMDFVTVSLYDWLYHELPIDNLFLFVTGHPY